MTWDSEKRQLDLSDRPQFITAGRHNMTHPVAMLHHRVPWNTLGGVLNDILAGRADVNILNSLLKFSPSPSKPLLEGFKAALALVLADKTLQPKHVDAINAMEAEIFSLPGNLFLGRNNRADDPGDDIDFTPDDLDENGAFRDSDLGMAQRWREKLMAALLRRSADDVKLTCTELAEQWGKKCGYPRDTATPFTPTHWARRADQYVTPAYRNWVKDGVPLTADQCKELNKIAGDRVKKS